MAPAEYPVVEPEKRPSYKGKQLLKGKAPEKRGKKAQSNPQEEAGTSSQKGYSPGEDSGHKGR